MAPAESASSTHHQPSWAECPLCCSTHPPHESCPCIQQPKNNNNNINNPLLLRTTINNAPSSPSSSSLNHPPSLFASGESSGIPPSNNTLWGECPECWQAHPLVHGRCTRNPPPPIRSSSALPSNASSSLAMGGTIQRGQDTLGIPEEPARFLKSSSCASPQAASAEAMSAMSSSAPAGYGNGSSSSLIVDAESPPSELSPARCDLGQPAPSSSSSSSSCCSCGNCCECLEAKLRQRGGAVSVVRQHHILSTSPRSSRQGGPGCTNGPPPYINPSGLPLHMPSSPGCANGAPLYSSGSPRHNNVSGASVHRAGSLGYTNGISQQQQMLARTSSGHLSGPVSPSSSFLFSQMSSSAQMQPPNGAHMAPPQPRMPSSPHMPSSSHMHSSSHMPPLSPLPQGFGLPPPGPRSPMNRGRPTEPLNRGNGTTESVNRGSVSARRPPPAPSADDLSGYASTPNNPPWPLSPLGMQHQTRNPSPLSRGSTPSNGLAAATYSLPSPKHQDYSFPYHHHHYQQTGMTSSSSSSLHSGTPLSPAQGAPLGASMSLPLSTSRPPTFPPPQSNPSHMRHGLQTDNNTMQHEALPLSPEAIFAILPEAMDERVHVFSPFTPSQGIQRSTTQPTAHPHPHPQPQPLPTLNASGNHGDPLFSSAQQRGRQQQQQQQILVLDGDVPSADVASPAPSSSTAAPGRYHKKAPPPLLVPSRCTASNKTSKGTLIKALDAAAAGPLTAPGRYKSSASPSTLDTPICNTRGASTKQAASEEEKAEATLGVRAASASEKPAPTLAPSSSSPSLASSSCASPSPRTPGKYKQKAPFALAVPPRASAGASRAGKGENATLSKGESAAHSKSEKATPSKGEKVDKAEKGDKGESTERNEKGGTGGNAVLVPNSSSFPSRYQESPRSDGRNPTSIQGKGKPPMSVPSTPPGTGALGRNVLGAGGKGLVDPRGLRSPGASVPGGRGSLDRSEVQKGASGRSEVGVGAERRAKQWLHPFGIPMNGAKAVEEIQKGEQGGGSFPEGECGKGACKSSKGRKEEASSRDLKKLGDLERVSSISSHKGESPDMSSKKSEALERVSSISSHKGESPDKSSKKAQVLERSSSARLGKEGNLERACSISSKKGESPEMSSKAKSHALDKSASAKHSKGEDLDSVCSSSRDKGESPDKPRDKSTKSAHGLDRSLSAREGNEVKQNPKGSSRAILEDPVVVLRERRTRRHSLESSPREDSLKRVSSSGANADSLLRGTGSPLKSSLKSPKPVVFLWSTSPVASPKRVQFKEVVEIRKFVPGEVN